MKKLRDNMFIRSLLSVISKKSVIEVEINSTYLNKKPDEQLLPFYMKYTWIHGNPAYLKSI